MTYIVNFCYCGDGETEEFPNLVAAMEWMQPRINSDSYSDLRLFKEIPLKFYVEIASVEIA